MFVPYLSLYSVLLTCSGLLLFGIGYNALVAELERRKIEGYTWHQVAGGVAVTLIGAAFLIGLPAALLVALCMAFSGAPMIMGAWWRHRVLQQAYERRLKAVALEKPRDGKQA